MRVLITTIVLILASFNLSATQIKMGELQVTILGSGTPAPSTTQ